MTTITQTIEKHFREWTHKTPCVRASWIRVRIPFVLILLPYTSRCFVAAQTFYSTISCRSFNVSHRNSKSICIFYGPNITSTVHIHGRCWRRCRRFIMRAPPLYPRYVPRHKASVGWELAQNEHFASRPTHVHRHSDYTLFA